MADSNQYLQLRLGRANYLLPNASGYSIEQRESLITNKSPDGNVAAWRSVRGTRQPAYCLDATLRVTRHQHWHRAVYLDADPHAVGLVIDEIELLPREEMTIVPFTPVGTPPTSLGHLFSAGWVTGNRVVLVFDPSVFIAYLQSLGEE